MDTTVKKSAIVTGGSKGLGLALSRALVERGWDVITDARDEKRLGKVTATEGVTGLPGDLTDPSHRAALVEAVEARGGLDLLVHNASTLGPVPLRPLSRLEPDQLAQVFLTNAEAPLALTVALRPMLAARQGVILAISSDAAVEQYEGWGAYGASKAALDHLMLTFAAESGLHAYAVDPGDMRTDMHQDAFPGEDISDRPLPETVVPRLLALLDQRPPSGRFRAAEVTLLPTSGSSR